MMCSTSRAEKRGFCFMKTSIIIPARHEIYLKQTVEDLLKKTGDVEIIVILDGYWPHELLPDDPRITQVHRERRGMRASINSAVAIAKGEYLLKMDAHCMVAEGFDEVLKADCDGDWIVVPRRYSLEPDTWEVRTHRPFVDYEYLAWPWRPHQKRGVLGIGGMVWDQRIIDRINILLDENMTFQGSCWFMTKEHFVKRLGKMEEEGYETFIGEAQEIGLKTWLGGGKCMTNKKTWYAHLWKGEPYREAYQKIFGFPYTRISWHERKRGNLFAIDYWINNRWAGRVHDLAWLIERFWPVPHWPEDRQWTHSI